MSEIAEDGPLLCLVDDAQWPDRASADALSFAARRLDAEGVARPFAARDGFAAQGCRSAGSARSTPSRPPSCRTEHS